MAGGKHPSGFRVIHPQYPHGSHRRSNLGFGTFLSHLPTVGRFILDHLLSPIGRVVRWVWNVVGVPIINGIVQATLWLADAVAEAAQAIFNRVIYPTGQFVVSAFEAAYESVFAAGQSIQKALYFSTGNG